MGVLSKNFQGSQPTRPAGRSGQRGFQNLARCSTSHGSGLGVWRFSNLTGRVGSRRVGSGRVGSGRVGSGRVGSGHPESTGPAGCDSTREKISGIKWSLTWVYWSGCVVRVLLAISADVVMFSSTSRLIPRRMSYHNLTTLPSIYRYRGRVV